MSLDAVKILEISITKNSKNEILEFIRNGLASEAENLDKRGKNSKKSKKFLTIVTPNPEQIVYARGDKHFRDILNRADVALPDGIGIIWASRVLSSSRITNHGLRITKVIPGIEFMENLVSEAGKQRIPIALIGGRGGLALKTLDCLQKTHQKLVGWAVDGPDLRVASCELRVTGENVEKYFKDLANKIVTSGVRIVFVGLGAPKQEYFIEALAYRVQRIVEKQKRIQTKRSPLNPVFPLILMSVGGSFDEIAGRIPRAPWWANRAGLKWLWRLFCQPWRIKRQLALPKFMWLVVLERYRLN